MHAIRTALLPLQFCADCITATRGYDFREGQPILIDSFASRFCVLLGFYRTISYGLSLFVHTVTAVVSWRQLFDHGDWPRSAAIYLDLADLGRFRRAVPSARTGHLDSRWLASIAKRSTDLSGDEALVTGPQRKPRRSGAESLSSSGVGSSNPTCPNLETRMP